MELNLTQGARVTLFVVAYAILTLYVGLRWETGNDWANYFIFYSHLPSVLPDLVGSEPGFQIFNEAVHAIGLNFAGFNLIYAACYLGLIFLSLRLDNFEISGWVILQIYSPFLFGVMGTMRQAMAVAICIYSVRYLRERNGKKFLLCVATATTFHISAPLFLLAWPATRVRLTRSRAWVILAACVLLSLTNLTGMAVKSLEDHLAVLRFADLESHLVLEEESTAQMYNPAGGAVAAILPTISILSMLALFILCFPYFREETDHVYLKLYFTSVLIILLLSSTVYVLAQRASLYFSVFQFYLLALLTRRLPRGVLRKAFCIALVGVSLARMWTSTHMSNPKIFIPYKGVFINQNVHRDLGWFR